MVKFSTVQLFQTISSSSTLSNSHVLYFLSTDQDMDGEAIATAFATLPGPDCLRDVLGFNYYKEPEHHILVIVKSLPGGVVVLSIGVSSRHQYAKPHPREGFNYYIYSTSPLFLWQQVGIIFHILTGSCRFCRFCSIYHRKL